MATYNEAITAYICRIHNPIKRSYAMAYANYLAHKDETILTAGGHELSYSEPPKPDNLSYMAAQAVRHDLNTLFAQEN